MRAWRTKSRSVVFEKIEISVILTKTSLKIYYVKNSRLKFNFSALKRKLKLSYCRQAPRNFKTLFS